VIEKGAGQWKRPLAAAENSFASVFFERLTLFQVLGIWQLNSQHWWSVASGALVCGALCGNLVNLVAEDEIELRYGKI